MSIERARQLRKSMSPAEAKMWTILRNAPLKVWHFRRQVQIGPYYADFVCAKVKLVIEIDGGQHYEDAAMVYDARRTAVIEADGWRVMRFATTDVMHHAGGVAEILLAELRRT